MPGGKRKSLPSEALLFTPPWKQVKWTHTEKKMVYFKLKTKVLKITSINITLKMRGECHENEYQARF